jgi:hypothetical protein
MYLLFPYKEIRSMYISVYLAKVKSLVKDPCEILLCYTLI